MQLNVIWPEYCPKLSVSSASFGPFPVAAAVAAAIGGGGSFHWVNPIYSACQELCEHKGFTGLCACPSV